MIATAWGTRGDVTPYVAIGAELVKRGHEVALISNPVFEPQALEAGLSFVPVGTASEYDAFVAEPGLWDWRSHIGTGVAYMLPTVEGFYRAVVETYRPGETVLLASRHGSWIAREARYPVRRAPPVSARSQPSRSAASRAAVSGLDRLDRAPAVGASAAPRYEGPAEAFSSHASAEPHSPDRSGRSKSSSNAFAPSPVFRITRPRRSCQPLPSVFGLPGSHPRRRTGQPILEPPAFCSTRSRPQAPGQRTVTAEVDPIVFTRGSAARGQRAFFEEALRCCRELGSPGVLLTPHAADVPSELPADVRHTAFASLGELFSSARAVVHHGGVGTMAYAFAAGLPQVVIPIVAEQFDLGYRMERLGVGSMLAADRVPAGRLARELSSLCASEGVRRRCESLRDQIDPEAGSSRAVDWIEEVISSSLLGRLRA